MNPSNGIGGAACRTCSCYCDLWEDVRRWAVLGRPALFGQRGFIVIVVMFVTVLAIMAVLATMSMVMSTMAKNNEANKIGS